MELREIRAKRLRRLRERAGMTQKELGDRLGVTDAAVGMWERGAREPDADTYVRLAEIFGTTIDYLLGRSAVPAPVSAAYTHREDDYDEELPEEALRSIEEFREYIRQKYGKRKEQPPQG